MSNCKKHIDYMPPKELREKWVQDFLKKNNFKEIPKFEMVTPLNDEAVIVLKKLSKKVKNGTDD